MNRLALKHWLTLGALGASLLSGCNNTVNRPQLLPPVSARFDEIVPNPIHNYWHNMEQINGGKNNKFVAMSTVGAWVMGYYDGSAMKMWQWARRYTLADNFFMGADRKSVV